MKKLAQILPLFLLVVVSPLVAVSQTLVTPKLATLHASTNWHIEPSMVFDTLCVLNVLSGDEFYVNYYKDEYVRLEPTLTREARAALANLKRKIKDEKGGIISAFLTLYFSATDHRTIDDLLRTLRDDEKLKASLKKTPYYNEPDWLLFQSVKPDLKTIFLFLKATNFEEYWKTNILPTMSRKIAEIRKDLPAYNVVAQVESLLGFPLPTDELTVYILKYSQPHGIRITGLRFLTDAAYPFKIVLRNAIHEPMHPPFSLASDSELRTALNSLQADQFLMDKVKNHDPSFGYNSFDGFIEEDCIQALEQIISEDFKVEIEARRRWKENDGGMHVFAVALYSVMRDENFDGKRENFRAFLLRMIGSGKLSAGRIKPINDAFYSKLPDVRAVFMLPTLKDKRRNKMSDKNKEIVKKINESFTAGNADGFLEHCADNVVWNMVGDKETRGKTAIKEWMSQMEGMEPPKFSVDKIIAEGDSVICYGDMTMKGEDGKEGKYSYVDAYQFSGDKIAELQSFIVKHKTEEESKKKAA